MSLWMGNLSTRGYISTAVFMTTPALVSEFYPVVFFC